MRYDAPAPCAPPPRAPLPFCCVCHDMPLFDADVFERRYAHVAPLDTRLCYAANRFSLPECYLLTPFSLRCHMPLMPPRHDAGFAMLASAPRCCRAAAPAVLRCHAAFYITRDDAARVEMLRCRAAMRRERAAFTQQRTRVMRYIRQRGERCSAQRKICVKSARMRTRGMLMIISDYLTFTPP